MPQYASFAERLLAQAAAKRASAAAHKELMLRLGLPLLIERQEKAKDRAQALLLEDKRTAREMEEIRQNNDLKTAIEAAKHDIELLKLKNTGQPEFEWVSDPKNPGKEIAYLKNDPSGRVMGTRSGGKQSLSDMMSVGEEVIIPGASGEEAIANYSETEKVLIRAIARYDKDPKIRAPGFAFDKWQRLLAGVYAYNPEFDEKNYAPYQAAIRDYTAGTSSRKGKTINQIYGHIENLDKARKALNNASTEILNYPRNILLKSVSALPEFTAYKQAKNIVRNDLANALREGGSGATIPDIQSWDSLAGEYESSINQKAAIDEAMHIMKTRTQAHVEGFVKAIGGDPAQLPKGFHFLDRETIKSIMRLGDDPSQHDYTLPPLGGQ